MLCSIAQPFYDSLTTVLTTTGANVAGRSGTPAEYSYLERTVKDAAGRYATVLETVALPAELRPYLGPL